MPGPIESAATRASLEAVANSVVGQTDRGGREAAAAKWEAGLLIYSQGTRESFVRVRDAVG